MRDGIAVERKKADIAHVIYDARKAAGMTRAQLAKAIRTKQSIIARTESADYDGHSFKALHADRPGAEHDLAGRVASRELARETCTRQRVKSRNVTSP